MEIIEITESYLQQAKPGQGTIRKEPDYQDKNHAEEIEMAEWIHETFGGDITLLAEKDGVYLEKSADYEWNGKLWELKTVRSVKGIDAAVRKAIPQIRKNPGGAILHLRNDETLTKVMKTIEARMLTSFRFSMDIMVVMNKKLLIINRYK